MTDEGPDAFVEELLARLRSAGDRTAAAGTLTAVAAPRLLRGTGGSDHLARVLANPLFGPLLEAERLECAHVQRIEDTARAEIVATGTDGALAHFTMSLALRAADAGRAPEWRVTGLVRAERTEA